MAIRKSPYNVQKIHSFKRTLLTTVAIDFNTGVTESHGVITFVLDQLQNYTEFTALFDFYRIKGIKMKWYPRINVNDTRNIVDSYITPPPLVLVVDQNDATSEAYTALIQYENAKTYSEYKPIKIYFRPKAQNTSNAMLKSDWISTDSSGDSVVYNALKWASFPYTAAGSNVADPTWDVAITYYVQCKQPK